MVCAGLYAQYHHVTAVLRLWRKAGRLEVVVVRVRKEDVLRFVSYEWMVEKQELGKFSVSIEHIENICMHAFLRVCGALLMRVLP